MTNLKSLAFFKKAKSWGRLTEPPAKSKEPADYKLAKNGRRVYMLNWWRCTCRGCGFPFWAADNDAPFCGKCLGKGDEK